MKKLKPSDIEEAILKDALGSAVQRTGYLQTTHLPPVGVQEPVDIDKSDPIDAFIRDVTQVGPMAKSEVRRRLRELLVEAYNRGRTEKDPSLKDVMKLTYE